MSKAKRITQKRLDNLRLEVELDNINQNANLTMAPIKQQMLKPSDMKYLVSDESQKPQFGFEDNVLDYDADAESASDYVRRIQNTNLGAYSTQKLEGESDENYVLRMQSLKASLPSQDRAVAMEKEKEKLQFRNYLTAVASPTVAETIINNGFFKGDAGEDHVRLLVRAWPSFIKELKETYSKLDVESFVEFAQIWVDKIQTTKGVKNPVNVEPQVVVASGDNPLDFAKRISATKIEIRNTIGNKLVLGTKWKYSWQSFLKFPEFWDLFTEINRDGKRTTTKAKYFEGYDILNSNIDQIDPDPNPIPQAFATVDDDDDDGGDSFTGSPKDAFIASPPNRRSNALPKPKKDGKGIYAHRKKYGHGISAKTDEPEYREFGRLIVSMPKLSDGILRVLYASNGINIAGIKSTHISEDFKDLIMAIIETGKFNSRLFERLPNSEKPLFKKLIDVAKLKHKLGAGNLVDENEKQNMQRWELVRGEIESGNDNISLKKEAKKLISYFMKSGRLSKSEAYDLLIQLSL